MPAAVPACSAGTLPITMMVSAGTTKAPAKETGTSSSTSCQAGWSGRTASSRSIAPAVPVRPMVMDSRAPIRATMRAATVTFTSVTTAVIGANSRPVTVDDLCATCWKYRLSRKITP